ncbi:hypothetical protein TA3x_004435 [Tundrisphaera sp. TA3]|uniref:hypothetical protein n=1 Tax=Tundrisphaera sp. TA3 TaxID=3435775 RepID=UPI003EB6B7C6
MFDRLPPKPGVLNLIGVISLLWSLTTVLGVVVGILVLIGLSAGSWLLGPVAGAVGSLLGVLGILWLIAASILSVMLFMAGWRTLQGDPSGIRLHRTWAWISLVLDAVGLLISGGLYVGSWWGVLYAVGVLYVTRTPEVLAYLDVIEGRGYLKPTAPFDRDF